MLLGDRAKHRAGVTTLKSIVTTGIYLPLTRIDFFKEDPILLEMMDAAEELKTYKRAFITE